MDCNKIGKLIAGLRKEMGLTQKNIADALGIQSKTVSKWECGLGCPDLSYWAELSTILGVDIKQMMKGEITLNKPDNGNINRIRFYVCPVCNNILIGTGGASIFCCGRRLDALKTDHGSDEKLNLNISDVDTENYIEFTHQMEKDHYIMFAAYVKYNSIYMVRLYPEQEPAFRMPSGRGGKLYMYCSEHGLKCYNNIQAGNKNVNN